MIVFIEIVYISYLPPSWWPLVCYLGRRLRRRKVARYQQFRKSYDEYFKLNDTDTMLRQAKSMEQGRLNPCPVSEYNQLLSAYFKRRLSENNNCWN